MWSDCVDSRRSRERVHLTEQTIEEVFALSGSGRFLLFRPRGGIPARETWRDRGPYGLPNSALTAGLVTLPMLFRGRSDTTFSFVGIR
jgi:hypothetical protein